MIRSKAIRNAAKGQDCTARHEQVFEFMRTFFAEYDRIPSAQTIQRHFGWASPNAAQEHIWLLAKKGLIERVDHGHYRFARNKQ